MKTLLSFTLALWLLAGSGSTQVQAQKQVQTQEQTYQLIGKQWFAEAQILQATQTQEQHVIAFTAFGDRKTGQFQGLMLTEHTLLTPGAIALVLDCIACTVRHDNLVMLYPSHNSAAALFELQHQSAEADRAALQQYPLAQVQVTAKYVRGQRYIFQPPADYLQKTTADAQAAVAQLR